MTGRPGGLAAALAMLSCGGGAASGGADTLPDSVVETAVVDTIAADSLVMPDVPAGERGRLVTASAGRDTLAGSWDVRAGRCGEPPSLQVMSETGQVGTLLLLLLPDSGPPTVDYPIHPADTTLGPGAARIAVQLFRTPRPAAYDVHGGVVTLERLDGRRVTGRFTATLRNVTTRDSVLYVGVFRDVAVDSLPAGLCATAADTTIAD